MSDERALTTAEVAERLRVSPKTVRAWLEQGELRGFKLPGGEWRIWPAALGELLQRFEAGHNDARRVS
jgi:excisionase family DNA binding protein